MSTIISGGEGGHARARGKKHLLNDLVPFLLIDLLPSEVLLFFSLFLSK